MATLTISGQAVAFDKEGYLKNLTQWTPEVADALALREGIDLTEAHWEIIELLQRFHRQFEHSPAMRILVKAVSMELGGEKGKSIYLLTLFPGSPAKLAARIAGLPRPTYCL